MKSATSMPASRQRASASPTRSRWPATSRPPSVVSSARRSGTNVAWSGLISRAIAMIAGLEGQLEVEPDLDGLAEQAQVAVLDVAAVFAEMDR